MWLATGSPNGQVRAIASLKLEKMAAKLKAEAAPSEADHAQHALLTADIRRFLERPAPIGGDAEMDWLAPVRSRRHIANYHRSQADERFIADFPLIRDDGPWPNPRILANCDAAIHHSSVADERTCAHLDSVRQLLVARGSENRGSPAPGLGPQDGQLCAVPY